MSQRFKYISLGIIILAFSFLSCKNDRQTKSASSLWGGLPTQLVDTLKKIGQQIQTREIDPTKDNIVIGNSGTRFMISAKSIIDDKGNPFIDKVLFEVKENYSFGDFIASNLQTVHNNEILQTQGMVYFAAISKNGQTLGINKDKPIRIEFPVNEIVPNAKIFEGRREEDGNMNWDSIIEPNKLLTPFPIRMIAPQSFGECPKDFGITTDKKYYNEHKGEIYLTFDSISKYENTLIATREFKERFYSYCMPDLTKIYIGNLDKNMWEIDEKMVEYFIKDSTERVNFSVNNKPHSLNKQGVTQEQKQAYQWLIEHDKENGHTMIELFKKFAAEKLTKIDTNRKVAPAIIKESRTAFVSYDALEFGWVNIDYFFRDPKAEKIKIGVKTNIESMIINLVIPGRKVILTGIPKGDNTYWFTKEKNGYNKLPKGEKAFIVCMSIFDKKLLFADKEIVIGQRETEMLNLIETSGETIKTRMKTYDR